MPGLAAVFLLLAAAGPPSFSLTGTVSWSEPLPPVATHVARDAHVCGVDGPIYRHQVACDDKGRVEGALVYLELAETKTKTKTKPKSALIDQKSCVYQPRVVTLTVGSSIRFRNSDPLLHNVRVLDASGTTVANYAMPVRGQETPKLVLDRPGRYEVVCEAGHAWMNAHVFVFAHPFSAVTPVGGAFRFDGIPVGRYKLVAWHPDLGMTTLDLDGKGGLSRVHLSFRGKPPDW